MLGTGGMAAGPMGEDELGIGGQDAGSGLEPEDELEGLDGEDELGLEGEEDGSMEVDKEQLRRLLDDVEMGNISAEEAFEECCALKDADDVSELGADGPEDLSDMGGEGEGMEMSMGEGGFPGMHEGIDINKIAGMLTDDPDIFK